MIVDELKRLMDLLEEMEEEGKVASFEEIADELDIDASEVERLIDVLVVTGKIKPESVGGTCSVSNSCSKCPLRAVCPQSSGASGSMKKFVIS